MKENQVELHDTPAGAYMCLFRNRPQTPPIAAQIISGVFDAEEKLPVSLPDFPAGHRLSLVR